MMINMVKRKKAKKRGPKFPQGEGKIRVLLTALNHPDGIGEENLIAEIKGNLLVTSKRSIKGHLDDLGPGRTVGGKWIKGKEYLVKIPSKYEPKAKRENLIKILKNQVAEIEVEEVKLPEENYWTPYSNIKIFKQMVEDTYHAGWEFIFSFIQTKHVKKMIDDVVINDFESRTGISYDEYEKASIKLILTLSPLALKSSLSSEFPEVAIAEVLQFAEIIGGVTAMHENLSFTGALLLLVAALTDDTNVPETVKKKNRIITLLTACLMADIVNNPTHYNEQIYARVSEWAETIEEIEHRHQPQRPDIHIIDIDLPPPE